VAETYRLVRNAALTYELAVVMLVHSTRPTDGNEFRAPRMAEIAESAYIERRARCVLATWMEDVNPATANVTVLKLTEGKRGQTLSIPRISYAAMLSADGEARTVAYASEPAGPWQYAEEVAS
jgi:hypothetical protein